ncbi:MAG TPA: DUF1552 domain-containing protein [Bryobacteraceae bacterium]|jgi:hypothetical protein|nr:DUF1552 domain-containing protein [Bryobacteraceae bacterium]
MTTMPQSTNSAPRMTRRAILRGAGCTLALPFLPSLDAWADTPPAASFPKRFAVVFLGNGINEDHWSAEGAGAEMKLSKTLSPLEPLKQKINVIDGLFVKALTGQGIHPAQTGSLLSGAHISKGAIIHSGISVDQMIAARVGAETPQSSIVLACDQPMTGYHESNFSLAYSSHISWQTPDSPVPVEVYPSLAWDSLFDNRASMQNISILDRVKDRVEALSRRISATDTRKLDEYLTSVREVEKRVEGTRQAKAGADDAAKAKNTVAATMDRPANGLPEDLREHARLMCDIIAIAFQTNKTRVASLIISRDLSAMYYPFLEVREGHHAASHANNTDAYERIARFHVSQFAYLAGKLDAMQEGDGTVLDHSCLMFLSNMWIGRKHDNFRLPLVLAGGLGGTLETGRVLNYLDAGEDNRKMCSLYLSLMDRFGIKLEQFGDAKERLERL